MAHLDVAYKCCLCGQVPEEAPIFHCVNLHQYCNDCVKKLQRMYSGSIQDGSKCVVCEFSGKFEKTNVTTNFLRKIKIKPGIGRPFRYHGNRHRNHQESTACLHLNQGDGPAEAAQSLKSDKRFSNNNTSKKPISCLHDSCQKSVAVALLVSHFKHDHPTVQTYHVERGKELAILLDLTIIEHDRNICLGMITVYETNRIDVVNSRSSQCVINTCNQFSRRVPINTFWIMVSGSHDTRRSHSYAAFWVYSNTDERFWTTMELSSQSNNIGVSTLCNCVGLQDGHSAEDVVKNLNCLYLNHGSFVSILGESDLTIFRILIHK